MIELAREAIQSSWSLQDFDHLALAYFNLNDRNSPQYLEFHEGHEETREDFFWDLASVTKVLTMGALALKEPKLFSEEERLLLEHRGGLPRWAILGKKSWKETVLKFSIKESEVEYSDISMLRLMILLEEKTGKNFKDLVDWYWDKELLFWKNLPENALCPETGFRQGNVISGEVNDDNAFKINRFCSHAGLFSTVRGLVNSLYNLEEDVDLLLKINKFFELKRKGEFLNGWRIMSKEIRQSSTDTLAGTLPPDKVFGHTGFTGTSVWIDADSGWGWVLLTNSTKKYWFNRKELNRLRYRLGSILWESLK